MIPQLDKILKVDILKEGKKEENFVGRLFYIDYEKVNVLISDAWKYKVKGVPQNSFLLAYYEGEEDVEEALLLRVLSPTKLPTDSDVISSMIEYYKDNIDIEGRAGSLKESKLDQFTRYEFSFSGLECRILGVFYKTTKDKIEFGADLENFYSANNYKVYKATGDALRAIVNQRTGEKVAGSENEFKIGKVRYSSSRRFQSQENEEIEVFISPDDFLGKRTALFGMTRTGKSNTIKKIIEATVEISNKAPNNNLPDSAEENNGLFGIENNLEMFTKDGKPKYKVGQIIFDINGEYANANMQDKGTAIFELYENDVIRYSVLEKNGFKVLKVNFYKEVQSAFDLIKASLADEKGDYIKSFCAVDLNKPENYNLSFDKKTSDERTATILYDRKKALFFCCLKKAGFSLPNNFNKIKFYGDANTINKLLSDIKPHNGISIDEAILWWETIYESSESEEEIEISKTKKIKKKELFDEYKNDKKVDFLDEDIKAMLVFLTRKQKPSGNATLSGYRKLRSLIDLHTSKSDSAFEIEIVNSLRQGKIIIIDLSQGNPDIQSLYSEKICQTIFNNSMNRFIKTQPNNFIQFYFEEAHNLFPKKDDKNLTQIYNRIAKEGAKLNLGMIYATQEVSSISSNILKNTQNWFIAHLNNEDETKELRKYYDFEDFTSSLIRFSANNDKGFVRMKTYTNPFVVPVQIDPFLANKGQ